MIHQLKAIYTGTGEDHGNKFNARLLAAAPEMIEALQMSMERVSPGAYLELFARLKREGWSTWGNEVPCDITLASESQRKAGESAGETSGRSAYNAATHAPGANENPLK